MFTNKESFMAKRKTATTAETAADPAAAPMEGIGSQATAAGQPDQAKDQQSGTEPPSTSTPVKKQYKPDPNPYPMEHIKAAGNIVRLFKELPNKAANFPGAFVIRFDKNPNEGHDAEGNPYGKDNPHPVLTFLKKESGHNWNFSNADGKGGWGKLWADGAFNFREHMDARVVLRKCAELLGPVLAAERTPF
jgi:hypothetical protein